jgi:hypothetical protein
MATLAAGPTGTEHKHFRSPISRSQINTCDNQAENQKNTEHFENKKSN